MDVYFYGLILSSYDEGNATDGNIVFTSGKCSYLFWILLYQIL